MNVSSGPISGMAFLRGSYGLTTDKTSEIEIWAMNTSATTFTDVTFIPEAQLTKVFDGTITHPRTAGSWLEIEFDNPFQYTGGNILFHVVKKDGVILSGGFYPYYVHSEGDSSTCIRAYSDTQLLRNNSDVATVSKKMDDHRPVIKLAFGMADQYNIVISNTEVTSENCANITSPDIVSGTVSFDTTTNTLTLNNLVMNSNSSSSSIYAANFDRGDLTINVVGTENNINGIVVSGYHNTTITGSESAKLAASQIEVLQIAGTEDIDGPITLTISNLNLKVYDIFEGYDYGIYGYGNEAVIFNRCNVEVKTNFCPVDEFEDITLTNCHIAYPVGAVVEGGCIRVNGEHDIDTVSIVRDVVGLEYTTTSDFTIAPNPAVDVVTLFGLDLTAAARLSVYNADGRLVAGIEVPAQDDALTMDVTTLPAGIYTVQVISGTTRYTTKMVKR